MSTTPAILVKLIENCHHVINQHADQISALDQAIGDGDHVSNLERGLAALMVQKDAISQLEWPAALQKIGMVVMSSIGGASGSLFGTLFVAMAKALNGQDIQAQKVADAFSLAVDAVKRRGKSDVGEKTMLDVLGPVAQHLQTQASVLPLPELLAQTKTVAVAGMESTRDMLATKGRASFLGERTKGHIDAGARSSQLMVCAVVDVLLDGLASPT